MDSLKPYWVKPQFNVVRLIKNIDSPWMDGNGGDINPAWVRANYKGACLFSKMEMGRDCWVKVWFYHSDLQSQFKNKTTREEYAYWIDPTWLMEIPL